MLRKIERMTAGAWINLVGKKLHIYTSIDKERIITDLNLILK